MIWVMIRISIYLSIAKLLPVLAFLGPIAKLVFTIAAVKQEVVIVDFIMPAIVAAAIMRVAARPIGQAVVGWQVVWCSN